MGWQCKQRISWGGLSACLLAVLALTGCATQENTGSRIPSGGNDCFRANAIYDWKALNDQALIVWSPGRSCAYRVDLAHRCMGLRFTEDIGFRDRDGRICPFGGDAIIVPGAAGEQCSIASIKRLTAEELDLLFPARRRDSADQREDGSSCNDMTEELK